MAARTKKPIAEAKPAAPQTMIPESEWTINGNPIPEHLFGQVPFGITDQGMEMANRGKTKARVQFVRDEFQQNLHRIEESIMPWEADNPIEAAIEAVRDLNMAYHLLGDRTVSREGLRGWEPCKDRNGRDVRVGNMTLSSMPKEKAKRRDDYYKHMSNDQVRDSVEDFKVKQEQMLRDAGQGDSLGVLRPGEMLTDWESGNQSSIGLHSSVGNSEN